MRKGLVAVALVLAVAFVPLAGCEEMLDLFGATPTPQMWVSEDETAYHLRFTWGYEGGEWEWSIDVTKQYYAYFREKPRATGGVNAYSEYVDNPEDDPWVEGLAGALRTASQEQGWDDYKTVGFVLAFVQGLPYTSDSVTTGYDDYPRYPVEALVDGGGDCEDTSILFASIVKEMGYGVALLYMEEDAHMAAGVAISRSLKDNWGRYYDTELTYYTTSGGTFYAYCETTGYGWELGQMPEDYAGTAVILPV